MEDVQPFRCIETRVHELASRTRRGVDEVSLAGGLVSESNVPAVVRYIENQEEHHRVTTFQDEYRALLKKHGIAFDETYVWD